MLIVPSSIKTHQLKLMFLPMLIDKKTDEIQLEMFPVQNGKRYDIFLSNSHCRMERYLPYSKTLGLLLIFFC